MWNQFLLNLKEVDSFLLYDFLLNALKHRSSLCYYGHHLFVVSSESMMMMMTLRFEMNLSNGSLPPPLGGNDTTTDAAAAAAAEGESSEMEVELGGYDEFFLQELCQRFDAFDRYNIVFNVIVVGPLCLFGFVGNALSLAVLRKDSSIKSTVSVLMQALAVADSFYLLTCLGFQTLSALCYSSDLVPGLMFVYPWMEVYIWPLASAAQTTTVWLVVVITVERYFAICRPFGALCRRSPGEMKIVVVVVFAAAAVYNIPRFFERQSPESYFNPCRGRVEWVSDHSALRNSRVYRFVYKTCAYFLFRFFLPLTLIVALNGLLVLRMRSQRRLHASLMMVTTRRLNSESVTILLLSMVGAFLLCQFPEFFVRLTVMVSEMTSLNVEVTYPTLVCNVLLTVNSSVNCLVYCMSGPRFRRILRRIVCGRSGGGGRDDGRARSNRSFTTFNSGSSRSLKVTYSNPRGVGGGGPGGGPGGGGVANGDGGTAQTIESAESMTGRADRPSDGSPKEAAIRTVTRHLSSATSAQHHHQQQQQPEGAQHLDASI